MAKIDKPNETQSRKDRYQDDKPSFFRQLREKYWDGPEPEELTFATKHQHGRKKDKKKIVVYFLLGLTVASTLGALATPIIRNIQAPKPKEEMKSNVTADQALEHEKDKVTKASEEKAEKAKKEEAAKKEEEQKTIDQKVKEELEKESAKVVEEYNKKLEEATKSVQSANSDAAKAKADKEALQKQVDELKQQLAQAQQNKQPAQSQPSQPTTPSSSDRVSIPQYQ